MATPQDSYADGAAATHEQLLAGLNEMLREVSAAFDAEEQESGGGAERRALPRRRGTCNVAVHCCHGPVTLNEQQREWLLHAAWQNGPLLDISLRAVAFVLEDEIAQGTNVLLRVRNRSLGIRVDTVGRVQRTETCKDGVQIICTLTKPLCLIELDSLGWTPTESQFI